MVKLRDALRNKALPVFVDIFFIMGGYFLALILKKEFVLSALDLANFKGYIPGVTVIYLITFFVIKIYRQMWVYASLKDYTNVFFANFVSALIIIFYDLFYKRAITISTIIIGTLIVFLLTEGIRILYRIFQTKELGSNVNQESPRVEALIVGAGDAGVMILKEIQRNPQVNYVIKGFVDDSEEKKNKMILRTPVVGKIIDLPDLVQEFSVQEIIFAIPSLPAAERQIILDKMSRLKVKIKTVPNLAKDLQVWGHEKPMMVDWTINDLLGRPEVELDIKSMNEYILGKTVLITGGGGSIGSELCRQVARCHPKKLIIFDIYENNAYTIQLELRRNHPELALETLIGSIRDRDKVNDLFNRYRPDVVFHAAAHKHVPLMEDSPLEALKNNVFGTLHLVEAADRFNVSRFVLISTDKAVNPTNMMGASKRLCEMIVQSYNSISAHTQYVAVRFGNVLGSNGSVVPIFLEQIKSGGPVTVTGRDVTRYFMSIPEAAKLVMSAGAMAEGGEVFVLQMGMPMKIWDLAENMIKLEGKVPGEDIKIVDIGLRPGEKRFEELLMDSEGTSKTINEKISVGLQKSPPWEVLEPKLNELRRVIYCDKPSLPELQVIVSQLVPTYDYLQKANKTAKACDSKE
ncbi:UDP-N-acetylglucosamine 4,6-dehydratase [Clostridiaceae bacterium JG1575]|nr:UDP-N-acetylglucosamine 4,6-dehydratase [Clostridiaceae bacterium JG1575]